MPFPPPGNLPNPGTEPAPLLSSALAGAFFTTSTNIRVKVQTKPQTCISGDLPILPVGKERSLLYTQDAFLSFEKINIKIPESPVCCVWIQCSLAVPEIELSWGDLKPHMLSRPWDSLLREVELSTSAGRLQSTLG